MSLFFFFFFNDTATTEIYTLSLHDALPIFQNHERISGQGYPNRLKGSEISPEAQLVGDRKSTRLNSSHDQISYAVFCLKKKKKNERNRDVHNTHPSSTHRTATSQCTHQSYH